MFIYKINSIDKLLTIAKNREYIENNPELCKLLENPLIHDDTELAIRYNEYKLNYPNAAEKFVDYFYTHGPELDIGSLDEWRKIIQNDPELLEFAHNNDTRIETIWADKQKDKDKNYSWSAIADLYDCLSKPCQYLSPISPLVGTIGDTQPKYNLKNTAGSDESTTLLGIPAYMINKMPRYLLQGITQLVDMISLQTTDVFNTLLRNSKAVKEDPYVLKDVETIGGDVLTTIASRMGDCFRLHEYKRRYNPYDYAQNKTAADQFGTVIYDENGNPRLITPTGNNMYNKTTVFSDNQRLNPTVSTSDIIVKDIGNVDPQNSMPFKITAYNSIFLSDNRFYHDNTDLTNHDAMSGNTSGGKFRIMPNSANSAKTIAKQNIELRNGCATRVKDVIKYFRALIISNYPTYSLPLNFDNLVIRGYKQGDLNVTLFFPNGQRTLTVFDCGGGPKESPWIDITAQYFFTKEGMGLANLYDSSGKIISSPQPVPSVINSAELSNIIPQPYNFTSIKVLGTDNNMVNGKYFFSESFCTTHGLDLDIFAHPGRNKEKTTNNTNKSIVSFADYVVSNETATPISSLNS